MLLQIRLTVILMLAILITGCSTAENINGAHYYLGFVRVDNDIQSTGTATRMRAVGIYAGEHTGIGYVDELRVTMDKDCSVLVIVPDEKSAEAYARQLNESLGETTCIFKKVVQN